MSKNILILPGDGIGQEVTTSMVEVLNFLIGKYNLDFVVTTMSVGGTAYNEYGTPLPHEVLEKAKTDGLKVTYEAVKSKLSQPIPLGYSNVGVIEEVSDDVGEFRVGDRVVSNGPHADVVVVKKNLCAKIPDNVNYDSAAFTVLGSIALQGIRLAKPTLGESFVVIGSGLVGLLTIQLLRANGCRVLGLDFDKERLKLAKSFGVNILDISNDVDIFPPLNPFNVVEAAIYIAAFAKALPFVSKNWPNFLLVVKSSNQTAPYLLKKRA